MSAKRKEISDYLWERGSYKGEGMPTPEELEVASSVLHYAWEYFIEPSTVRVFRVLNEASESYEDGTDERHHPVTYADVGAILSFITDVRDELEEIEERLTALEESRRDLSSACMAGRVEIEPRYNANGRPAWPTTAIESIAEAVGAR
ncbi:MAG: hypothetical protein H0U05_00800 [Actinobacteria bacterium]|nr:hypothetical protein [Actinomycetota bacterium]